MITSTVWTVNEIKTANRRAGYHWFDPSTMRFFGTRVSETVYQGVGGVYFVTSDKRYDSSRGYTVRQFNPEDASIDTAGEVGGWGTLAKAKNEARRLARADGSLQNVQQTVEKFQEVTVLEQFLSDIQKHGVQPHPACTEATAKDLIRAAHVHHYYCECACTDQIKADFAERNFPKVERRLKKLAEAAGATVRLSRDPRGCTVKLVFQDGYTNDFGREGYCVPTSLKTEDD